MDPLYRAQGLHYSYRLEDQEIPVLKGVDLTIPPGSFTCLVGPSGSGKTTLLNILGLLDRPSRGTLAMSGQDLSNLSEDEFEILRLKKLGFIFQSFHLIPTLTALENTAYFLGTLGRSRSQALERASAMLELVGLKDHRHKRPGQLSSGQCQRVAIARAVAKGPEVILADEPTANLDRTTAEDIISVFQDLRAKEKVSFLFATHDMHLVSYAETTFKLQDGRLEPGVAA
ncbi:MAG: ABC transporter ATP-binding protein [Elusimicrobia bacterium]|nr:ABC transporter ATP-binding protein [Elusimicrobiota bacterium]